MSNIQASVIVSVANIYKLGNYQSEVINQALLGERLSVLKKQKDFSQVASVDGYKGWISNQQWCEYQDISGPRVRVRAHIAHIFEAPDQRATRIRDAVLGCEMSLVTNREKWYQIRLPDGKEGWIEKKSTGEFAKASRKEVTGFAREFLGYPYFWGGRSPKGFDCSGFTQTVFSQYGILLPRDSWMQHKHLRRVSGKLSEAREGDLLFFAENGTEIKHVGIALGKGLMIHARGMVRINSLKKKDADYDENLAAAFVDVRSVL